MNCLFFCLFVNGLWMVCAVNHTDLQLGQTVTLVEQGTQICWLHTRHGAAGSRSSVRHTKHSRSSAPCFARASLSSMAVSTADRPTMIFFFRSFISLRDNLSRPMPNTLSRVSLRALRDPTCVVCGYGSWMSESVVHGMWLLRILSVQCW